MYAVLAETDNSHTVDGFAVHPVQRVFLVDSTLHLA